MKKIFLLIAFTGILGAASATSILTISKTSIVNVGGEDKKGDEKKKKKEKADCKKACAADKTAATAGCSHDSGKSCCKGKTEAKATVAPTAEPVKK